MNIATQKMLLLMSEAKEIGAPPDDLIELLQANRVGTPIERLMRIRALTELSIHTDVTTLIALAAAAATPGMAIDDVLSALRAGRRPPGAEIRDASAN